MTTSQTLPHAPAWTTTTTVEDGWDVFSIPHGGYLAGLAADAVLGLAGASDLFSVTIHYLRKAAVGPMEVTAAPIGGGRRLTTVHGTATQDGEPVLTLLASVGERAAFSGPSWTDHEAWDPDAAALTPPAGDPAVPFPTPAIAQRYGLRFDLEDAGFAMGHVGEHGRLRAVLDTEEPTLFDALVACDITPPAAWNALGRAGWVPTVELTAHVRALPGPGPLRVTASTRHVADGWLEEDALVHDAAGRLVVQSRQLARWTEAG